MLSEKEIEALKNGAYGVTRGRNTVRVINLLDNDVALVAVHELTWRFANYANFPYYHSFEEDTHLDIVGLWEDRPEPFNLERALAGEPIFNNNFGSGKAYLSKSSFDDETFIVEYENEVGLYGTSQLNIDFKMWKEPEPVKPSADDLPKPIREFGGVIEVWFIELDVSGNGYVPNNAVKGYIWTDKQHTRLSNGCYYASKKDCQAVCNWLMNR